MMASALRDFVTVAQFLTGLDLRNYLKRDSDLAFHIHVSSCLTAQLGFQAPLFPGSRSAAVLAFQSVTSTTAHPPMHKCFTSGGNSPR